ncbi:MAG: AAA family ATPase, partial [Sandaracinaceae bacterium]|nr:AAA family ATPase [Sandaracinaceae bacterium]
ERLQRELRSLEDEADRDSIDARVRIQEELEQLQPKLEQARARWTGTLARRGDVRRIKEELAAVQREYEQARGAEDHGRAGELRFGTIPLLEKRLADAEAQSGGEAADLDPAVRDRVTEADVADVVAAWTGVPVSRMLEGEAEKLLHMEERLRQRVIGQDPAVAAIAKAVRRGRVGLRDPRRPIGSFLFLGPTGVGKTELAKALAEFLFDDEHSLTRLDMSEFMEKHMVARLLGSPPGYVDSDEGGFLTEAVRNRPYSVVLFDEMEKAHPDVFNILLQVLDDGRLTDSRGRVAYFSDTVVVMTSNVGSHLILEHQGTNEELRELMQHQLHKAFRPEFLNRIDDVVIFDPLGRDELRGIVDIQLRGLGKLLADRRVRIDVTDAAKDHLVDLGYEPAFGARPLKRVILKHLQDPLAEAMLRGGYGAGDVVVVDKTDGDFTFRKKGAT